MKANDDDDDDDDDDDNNNNNNNNNNNDDNDNNNNNNYYYYYKDKDEDLFFGPQEFVVGYSKAPEQPQSSARPICHSHSMTKKGREPPTIHIAA